MRVPSGTTTTRTRLLQLLFGLWLGVVGAAFLLLSQYKNRPGPAGNAPECWPSESPIPLDTRLPTMLMFAHPRCPCTRASLRELERFMASSTQRVAATVVFLHYDVFSQAWDRTDLWHHAQAIPGVRVVTDADGREAQRFGATTSGQVLLYWPDARLLYHGGITSTRGHVGANFGLDRVSAIVEGRETSRSTAPVFGCPLHDSCGSCEKEKS